MPLGHLREPFSHPDWLYEVKWDGFRALLYSNKDGVRLVSRNGNVFQSFPSLGEGLWRDFKGGHCVLDGEIVCLDSQGRQGRFDVKWPYTGEPPVNVNNPIQRRCRAAFRWQPRIAFEISILRNDGGSYEETSCGFVLRLGVVAVGWNTSRSAGEFCKSDHDNNHD
jgi:ATP dependent DNA ligase domain